MNQSIDFPLVALITMCDPGSSFLRPAGSQMCAFRLTVAKIKGPRPRIDADEPGGDWIGGELFSVYSGRDVVRSS